MRRVVKYVLGVLLTLGVGVPFVLLALLPWYAPLVPIPDVTVDLSTNLTAEVSAKLTNRTVTARFATKRSRRGGVLVTAKGLLLDWPYTLAVDVDYSLLTLTGDVAFDLALDDSACRFEGRALATPRTWTAAVEIPKTRLTERDPALGDIVRRFLPPTLTNLTFSAQLDFRATAEKTRELPVPVWTARGRLADAEARGFSGNVPFALQGLSTTFGADGIADRVTVAPLFPRIKTVEAAGVTATDVFAMLRMTENQTFLVTEAGAKVCGGEVKLYSLYLDPAKLTTGFTLFLDDIDTNELIKLSPGFKGSASGRLHGKLPVFLKDGRKLRVRNSYLYSIPGETGTLRLEDASPIIDNLQIGGVDEATCNNLSKALANLVYSVLKLDLRRDEKGDLSLTLKLEGNTSSGKLTVPVNFEVTFHGDLQELIDTGFDLATKKK